MKPDKFDIQEIKFPTANDDNAFAFYADTNLRQGDSTSKVSSVNDVVVQRGGPKITVDAIDKCAIDRVPDIGAFIASGDKASNGNRASEEVKGMNETRSNCDLPEATKMKIIEVLWLEIENKNV